MVNNTGIRWRRFLRQFRALPQQLQLLGSAMVVVLVANMVLVGARSGDTDVPEIDNASAAAAESDDGTGGTAATQDGTAADAQAGGDVGASTDSPTAGTSDTGPAAGPAGSGSDADASTSTPGDPGSSSDGSSQPGGADAGSAGTPPSGGGGDPGAGEQPREYTASDRGVSPEAVKIVFPWFDLAATFAVTGSNSDDIENAENVINAMVDHINLNGGIDGRQIDPIIEEFNPLNETDMRAKCIRWAQDDKVFGVVDAGGWHVQHQLCLTEENDTPLVSEWTTEEEWTERGAPYLWWTAASANETIDNLLLWIREADLEPADGPLGALFSDREGDVLARDHFVAVAEQLGVDVHVETIPYDNAQAQAFVPGAVQRMRTAGVTRTIGMLPLTTMAFWLSGAESQNYYPHYVFSDYESNLVTAQALLGAQFPDSLGDSVGPTSFPLGEDTATKEYRPPEKECNDIWLSQRPDSEPLDVGGIGMRWCQNIFLFVEAAIDASARHGGALTRDRWAEAMGRIKDRPSQMTPVLSYSPDDRAGPTMVKVVKLLTEGCTPEQDEDGNGVCHVEISGYQRYRTV